MKELDSLDAQLRQVYGGLPESARNLVTTHDGYRYLASTYGLHIAGFVSASASGEPSIQQRQRLRRTVEDLKVPAIYLDKSTAMRSPVLTELAREAQVRTGVLYSGYPGCAGSSLRADDAGECSHDCAVLGGWFWRRFFGC